LQPWGEIKDLHTWSGILLGNGSSRAVWDQFGYNTLYEVACSDRVKHPLTDEDQKLFAAFDNTVNFEAVLGALYMAGKVCKVLGKDFSDIALRYVSIRRALIEAVHAVHVPWKSIDLAALVAIRKALLRYSFTYTTNYDLLLYWAIMAEDDGDGFKDFFWSEEFDVADTDIWGKVTKVLYLHGALHLYRRPAGGTIKDRAQAFANLLDRFGKKPSLLPLFISEGSHRQKVAAIMRSDYLSFALQQFASHVGPLVIFGQGLGDTDRHLVDVMRRWGDRPIAVSVYRLNDQQVIEEKSKINGLLPSAELHFFDAQTHPLGSPTLKVVPP
jgi:hypothetical protein